jgi:hypothetical protein
MQGEIRSAPPAFESFNVEQPALTLYTVGTNTNLRSNQHMQAHYAVEEKGAHLGTRFKHSHV